MRTLVLFVVLVACQAAILTIGGLALRTSSTDGVGLVDLALLLITGVQLPLLYFMLQRGPRRLVAAVLAVCFALVVNVSFVATSAPAAAVTDNSTVFTFARTSAFASPSLDMLQNYTPVGASTVCPTAAGFNFACSWTSDSFTSGQTYPSGTSQVDLYANNNPAPFFHSLSSNNVAGGTSCAMTKPSPLSDGDVLVSACAFRGGTGTTVTSVPSGWTLIGTRVDNTTTVSLVAYVHVVTTASSEPATYTWNLGASVKLAWAIAAYSGVDNTTPLDVDAGQATPSALTHDAPSVTTTVASDMLVTFHSDAICAAWTAPTGMTKRADTTTCTGGASSNVSLDANDMPLGAAGATGTQTATATQAAVGVTKTVTLRAASVARTCDLTVQLAKPVQYRATASNVANNSSSVVLNKPTGVVDGDVMVASIGTSYVSGLTVTPPSGWTFVGNGVNSACCFVWVYAKAASGEPASYTWNFSAAVYVAGGISAYWNVDTVTSVDVQAGAGSSGANETTPTVTTTQPDEMLVASFIGSVNGSWTPPTGMNERFDRVTTSTTFVTVEQADGIDPSAGGVSKTATVTPAAGSGATHIVALKSASGSGLLGSGTALITSPATNLLTSISIATPALTFLTGDHLQVDVIAPNDQANCGASVAYDGAAQPSKLTVNAVTVPEGIAGLLVLAPALPLVWRWRKRR